MCHAHQPAPHFVSKYNKNMRNFSSKKSAATNAIFVIRKRGNGRWINKLSCVRFCSGRNKTRKIAWRIELKLLSGCFGQLVRNRKLKLNSVGNKRNIMATDRKSSDKGSCLKPSKFNTVTFFLCCFPFPSLSSINCARVKNGKFYFPKR